MNDHDEMIEKLAHDESYGCYTRQGLVLVAWPQIADKATYIIFADLDDIHRLNSELGYAEVDLRIHKALKVRSSDAMAIGRYFSGDEIVWIISDGDPQGMVNRLQEALNEQGLSATFGIAPVVSKVLHENVEPATIQVQEAKKARGLKR